MGRSLQREVSIVIAGQVPTETTCEENGRPTAESAANYKRYGDSQPGQQPPIANSVLLQDIRATLGLPALAQLAACIAFIMPGDRLPP